jgi:glycosyltransferase involved in cell wall biosynthesis
LIHGVRVLVVVPAYREAPRIGRVLETMPPEVDEIIVVDDGSDDGTADEARARGSSRVTVSRHERNRGVGAAIATGYRRALSSGGGPRDAFVVMAGDGQMDPRDLPALVAPIARGDVGYAKGNRFGDAGHIPRGRYYGGRAMTALTRWAIGINVHDSQCGYTALSREVCARLDLDALWPGFGYPNDLLGMLVEANVAIREVPVRAIYLGRGNKLSAWDVPTIVRVILRNRVRRRG